MLLRVGRESTQDVCDLCVPPESGISCTATSSDIERSHPVDPESQRSNEASDEEEKSGSDLQDNKKPRVVIGGEQGPHQSTDVASRDSQSLRPSISVKDTATTSHQEDNTNASFPPDREVPRDISASHDLDRWLSTFKDEYRHYWKGLVNQIEVVASNCEDASSKCMSKFSSIKKCNINTQKSIDDHSTKLKNLCIQQYRDHTWVKDMIDQHNTKIELSHSDTERLDRKIVDKDEENKKWRTDIENQIMSLREEIAQKDSENARLKAILARSGGKIPDVGQETEKKVANGCVDSKQVEESTKLQIDSLNQRVTGQAAQINSLTQELTKAVSLITELTESRKSDKDSFASQITGLDEKVVQVASTVEDFSGDAVNALLGTNSLAKKVSDYKSELKKTKQVCADQGKEIHDLRDRVNIKDKELEETKTLCELQNNELTQVKCSMSTHKKVLKGLKTAVVSHGEEMGTIRNTLAMESKRLNSALSSQKGDIRDIKRSLHALGTKIDSPKVGHRKTILRSCDSNNSAGSYDSLSNQEYSECDRAFGYTDDSMTDGTNTATLAEHSDPDKKET
ncbi:hypothetical protein DAKH74_037910 [Maudiozyma humilis]|uniref:Uncharacterized protein n=1 Tax=Maudiozyma humilis TaxID=51915 RepID=A0AAV5RZZ3_MAUHU|nr:hypothetical protein DAKH74_037910 [Kazachstania humilis]